MPLEHSTASGMEDKAPIILELGPMSSFPIEEIAVPSQYVQALACNIVSGDLLCYPVKNYQSIVVPGDERGYIEAMTAGAEFCVVRTTNPLKSHIIPFDTLKELNPLLKVPSSITRGQFISRVLVGGFIGGMLATFPGMIQTSFEHNAALKKDREEFDEYLYRGAPKPKEREQFTLKSDLLQYARYAPHGAVVGGTIGVVCKKVASLFLGKKKPTHAATLSVDQPDLQSHVPSQQDVADQIRQEERSALVERLRRGSNN